MNVLALLLGKVMMLSYTIGMQNYPLSMMIFTLFTKIILLPVGLWTQKRSIKMVVMQPELNRIHIKYFGDKDAVADHTTELYQKNKYNPFANMIPLLIQIVILLSIVAVVRQPEYAGMTMNDLHTGNIFWGSYPYEAWGRYWLAPILAGISSVILSLAQNHINPLQREQSKRAQNSTMLLSVGISIGLGCIVPVGVALYWGCSNLLTIGQQLVLNMIINPNKYIDRKALDSTREELEELKGIGGEYRKFHNPYASKERADYKSFFHVVNKHIVFYSEKNGFYKYFENIINYLLENTKLTIHYVTSDPEDDIFEKAKSNPRIRGYYIGEKRLVTLFMKMDADIVVMTMTDLDNYHYKRSYIREDIEYVYVCHYPMSTHLVFHADAFDHYDTFLCVGDFQFDEIRKQEQLSGSKAKKLISCGYGQMENLQRAYDAVPVNAVNNRKKILLAPSWQVDNILDLCLDDVLKEVLGRGWHVVVRPHPEYMKRYQSRMDKIVERYRDYKGGDLEFELDFTKNNSIFESDVLITDWSGTAYEFAFVTGKPVAFIDTPMKIHNPDYKEIGIEPLEIRLRSQVGIRVSPGELTGFGKMIENLLEKTESYVDKNKALRDRYIANFGRSGEVGGEYLIASLRERAEKTKKKQ